MSTQHKALELAAKAGDMASIFATPSHERGVCNEVMQELRTQHALIVQMQEALRECLNCEFAVTDKAALSKAISTIAAADKYLGEQE